MKYEITRIDVLSTALAFGAVCAAFGLAVGVFVSLAALGITYHAPGVVRILFGLGALLVLPVMYGFGGFISGALFSFLYNLIAKSIGGIQLHMRTARDAQENTPPQSNN